MNKILVSDSDILTLFRNRISQEGNINANSELFINGDMVLKVYFGEDKINQYNLSVIRNIFRKRESLDKISELVLPGDLLIYNGKTVGFSMPYVKGNTLYDIFRYNLLDKKEIKELFIKLLNTIHSFSKLPFDFYLGDLHEKNVILDDNLNINIIDCDSFIINNKKLVLDDGISMGKYLNRHFGTEELKKIKKSGDYFGVLCMIFNYLFSDIVNYGYTNSIDVIKSKVKSRVLDKIFDRINDIYNFELCENDINDLFNEEYDYDVYNQEEMMALDQIQNEIKRIRKR